MVKILWDGELDNVESKNIGRSIDPKLWDLLSDSERITLLEMCIATFNDEFHAFHESYVKAVVFLKAQLAAEKSKNAAVEWKPGDRGHYIVYCNKVPRELISIDPGGLYYSSYYRMANVDDHPDFKFYRAVLPEVK